MGHYKKTKRKSQKTNVKKRIKNQWKRRWNRWKNRLTVLLGRMMKVSVLLLLAGAAAIFLTGGEFWHDETDQSPFSSYMLDEAVDFLEKSAEEIEDTLKELAKEPFEHIVCILHKTERMLRGEAFHNSITLDQIPEYNGEPYVVLLDNKPSFTKEEVKEESFESYSELDLLGRCGVATACVGQDIMPVEERGPIGMIRPSGWKLKKYDIVDGKYLYNRCHLIGFQLTGENANEKNLITGTRSMNVEGMLPFENQVADYVKSTGNHVMYRVTPVYDGDNLVASGVVMEALSVEDRGRGISFHIYVYNNQPGIKIDYSNGDSWLCEE